MRKVNPPDFSDPFVAGQMVGILVILTFLEKNGSIPQDMLEQLKNSAANNVQNYFHKPAEDIHLMIDNMVEEIHLI